MAMFATYRLARFLPYDDGPFFIFERFRIFTASKMMNENKEYGFWRMIDEAINCPFCLGLYGAALVYYLFWLDHPAPNTVIVILGLAGGQSLLQTITDRLEKKS